MYSFRIMKKAVILAQGNYPTHPYPLHILHTAPFLICTDGAVNDLGDVEPDLIIGDLDSLSGPLKEKYADRLVCDSCEETNDLTKAVTYCHTHGFRDITILGATGLREDHTLGNISLLGIYAHLSETVRMVTDHGIFLVFSKGQSDPDGFIRVIIPCEPGNPVSFFALDPRMQLTASGVRYPVEKVVFDAFWKASLNRCTGTNLYLGFRNGPLLVYLPHPTL